MIRRFFKSGMRAGVQKLIALSYEELSALYLLIVLLFAVIYFGFMVWWPAHAPTITATSRLVQLYDCIYFSVITATSVGYGDMAPHGISRIFSSFESIFALFVFAIVVSKLTSERQEAAIYQMHKVTIDGNLMTIREGLFIIRKDFDRIIKEIEEVHSVSEKSLDNMTTALRQIEVLLEDIPSFYDSEHNLYSIDPRREELLAESVERTMERLHQTFVIAEKEKVLLLHHPEVRQSITALVHDAELIIAEWKINAPESMHPTLDRITAFLKGLHQETV